MKIIEKDGKRYQLVKTREAFNLAVIRSLERFKEYWSKIELKPRNPNRIWPICEEIEKVWSQFPDLRLGQMMLCAVGKDDLFNIEDKDLIKRLQEWAEQVTE